MPINLGSISLNDMSSDVGMLHNAFEALAFSVTKSEVGQSRTGADMRRRMRACQARLKAAVDGSAMPDEVTVLTIAEALEKRRRVPGS